MLVEDMIGGVEDEGMVGSGIGMLGSYGIIFGQKCLIGEILGDGIVCLLWYVYFCDGCVSEGVVILFMYKGMGGQMVFWEREWYLWCGFVMC